MQNEELIKALRAFFETDKGERLCMLAADALEAADKAQRWIPCAERLPEYDPSKGANAYWIAKKTRNGEWQMKIALYSDYGYATTVDIPENVTWRDYDFCQIMNVTHWQPLPQPPQKGEGHNLPQVIDEWNQMQEGKKDG